jgi:hypothetical protein
MVRLLALLHYFVWCPTATTGPHSSSKDHDACAPQLCLRLGPQPVFAASQENEAVTWARLTASATRARGLLVLAEIAEAGAQADMPFRAQSQRIP